MKATNFKWDLLEQLTKLDIVCDTYGFQSGIQSITVSKSLYSRIRAAVSPSLQYEGCTHGCLKKLVINTQRGTIEIKEGD